MPPKQRLRAILLGAVVLPACAATSAAAQQGFLFEQPRLTIGVRAGQHFASANGDLYDMFIDELTLERGDFSGATASLDIGVVVTPHIDLVASVGRSWSKARSEFRDWVGEDELPIEQTTSLQRTPLTATFKVYPMARGRTIGSNAWIPQRFTPFVAVGAGALHYDLEQEGEFVDAETLDIFPDRFEADGWAPTLHAAVGSDFWLSSRFGLVVEGRYQWGSAPLEGDFRGFDDIDLSGFQGTAGLSVRF